MIYLTPTKEHWACDIEADDLLDKATTIWCATAINLVTKEELEFFNAEDFKKFREEHPDAVFVGHNFLAYDGPMLNRHWGAGIPASRIVDTFVLSQLYNPTMKGGHSLEVWGERVRYSKGDFSDFSRYTPEMLKYCRRDTRLTGLVFLRLSERMRSVGFTEDGMRIEHLAWSIVQNKQKRNGFPLDYQKTHELYVHIRNRQEELQNEIYRLWPPQRQAVRTFAKAYKKDGTESASYSGHVGKYPELRINADGSYTAYDDVCFNLGSPAQRVEKLLELGWEPTSYTKAGNPKVDEDSLLAYAEVSGRAELLALAKWIVFYSRANMIRNWLDNYNDDTGAVHGSLFIASTLRYRHSNPNSANIPSVRLKKNDDGTESILYGEEGSFTYESRDCWVAGGPEWTLVGIDGTGIQNRCLIHNLIKVVGEEAVAPFKHLSLEGDIHKRNIEVLGLANKAAAKKFYYTLMMGGGGARLAADQVQFGTKMSAKEGEAKKKALVATIPGFGDLIKVLHRELDRTGRIKLCSGTPILVPSPHMVIPYLLQGDESQLMKQALIFLDREIRRAGLAEHCMKVADIHDEWQWRVRKEYVGEFIALALPCFPRAGEHFEYNIRIDGAAQEGRTWAETH